jgi:protein-S-isoprenylcysteine O-methyltransferase Ste14
MLERQGLHLALILVLVAAVWLLGGRAASIGEFAGLNTSFWLWASLVTAVLHQAFVALAWRAELHHRAISARFGRAAFILYASVFADLAFWRVAALVGLAYANLGVWSLPPALVVALTLVLGVPWAYLIYSITRHFGWRRALGSDHFDQVRPGLVREGLWGLVENPIYTLGPLFLYLPGLWLGAPVALLAAALQHAAIWAHWYCTEAPDMERIYGERADV